MKLFVTLYNHFLPQVEKVSFNCILLILTSFVLSIQTNNLSKGLNDLYEENDLVGFGSLDRDQTLFNHKEEMVMGKRNVKTLEEITISELLQVMTKNVRKLGRASKISKVETIMLLGNVIMACCCKS